MKSGPTFRVGAVIAALVVGAGTLLASAPAGAASGGGPRMHQESGGETDVNSCAAPSTAGVAMCFAHRRTDYFGEVDRPGAPGSQAKSAATVGNGGAYDPSYLRSAYNVASLATTGGTGKTVAVVDAYDDPNAAADMASYRSFFGLPACGSGCFTKINEQGGSTYPTGNSGWSQEISLDLDMVSAMCPNCHILLVEASSASLSDLGTAVNTAVSHGANVVSNSYGGSEYNGEAATDASYYHHPGVAITASSGDSGYGVMFPAAAPDVTAVGGTTLNQTGNGGTRNATETAWSGGGSGCSSYETKPTWQADSGCAARTVVDVSADADPNTGVWVYDTYASGGTWAIFGGTSASAAIIGGIYGLATAPTASAVPSSYAYATPSALNDVTSGSNGSCSPSYWCTAGGGYDGPTGLGTPNGVAAFGPGSSGGGGGGGGGGTVTKPSAPTNLVAKAGNASVALTWSAPSNLGGASSVSYTVTRNGSTAASGLTTTSFNDTGLANGTLYSYTVAAVNSAGASPASNTANATPTAAATVPSAPLSLTAVTNSRGVLLSWAAPASNGGSAITKYVIYRSTSSGRETMYGSFVCSTTTCSAVDTGAYWFYTYYYTVAAANAVGTGPQSNQASARG
jgi:hypothetical protein